MSIYNGGTKLSDCLGEAFYDMYWDIQDGNHTYYDLAGGRGSLKSSAVSLFIVLGITQDKLANAMVYRKVADTIGDSVYEQIVWAIDKLGMRDDWKCTTSPYRCTYKPTGQKIIFKGLDKAGKSKSAKVSVGYFKYLWFEEFDQFNGAEEIRSVQQSILRGGEKFVVFKSMNPPKSNMNWANAEMEKDKLREDVYVSETTYLTTPAQWLGTQFITDAEWLKEVNPLAYEHEYLGKAVGTGTEVFDNIVSRRITDNEIATFDRLYDGIDWGWYPDPFHYGRMNYNPATRVLTIFAEYRTNKTSNQEVWEYIKTHWIQSPYITITADSAEKKSCADLKSYGANIRPAEKGPNSIHEGIKWLQSLNAIEIDPRRCPKTYEEFTKYEYEKTKDGEPLSGYPDENNHSIDMTRYAMERVWKRRGN